jgi:hypothetical protein
MVIKKIHLIGTRTRDLPTCSIVPQPTALPRAHRRDLSVKQNLELTEKLESGVSVTYVREAYGHPLPPKSRI